MHTLDHLKDAKVAKPKEAVGRNRLLEGLKEKLQAISGKKPAEL